jgi:membrane associated rhomboid family serine protease
MFALTDINPDVRKPIVTWIIIAINLLVFAYELHLGYAQRQWFFTEHGTVPVVVLNFFDLDQLGCLIGSLFMHNGWVHLISNMWCLSVFGDNVEDRMGHKSFLFFYLLVGVLSSLTFVVAQPTSAYPIIGASGAIAGILGAYVFLYPDARIRTLWLVGRWPVVYKIPALAFIGIWIVCQFFPDLWMFNFSMAGLRTDSVAAHLSGFILGLVLVKLFAKPIRLKDW